MIHFTEDDIKKKRTIKIFIAATARIIKNEGIESVTIRRVAKLSGYNSATIYNYFDNIQQLIFFAAIKFIKDYVREMPSYIDQSSDPLERFLLMWEIFCLHSFRKPQIYYAIFSVDIGDRPENLVSSYYKLFPEELGNPPEDLIPMLLESTLSKRNSLAIQPSVDKGYFSPEEAKYIDEVTRLVYHGMISLMVNNRVDYSAEEAVEKTINHIRQVINDTINNNTRIEMLM